jgi:tetratricopeptide (TPR) repeat protein
MRIQAPEKLWTIKETAETSVPFCRKNLLLPLFTSAFAFCLLGPPAAFPQTGAPEIDVRDIPGTITDTRDRVHERDLKRSDPAEQKTPEMDECLLPPLNLVKSPLVSASALAAPAKAKKEYADACAALKQKKTEIAEKHLRNAVQKYFKYSAAWVTLGQLLASQNNIAEARKACAQGSTVEPNYIPAYLCLAELAARERAWGDVLLFSNRVLQLDSNTIPIAYEYSAAANLRSDKLDEAEKMAKRALEMDKKNTDPRVHFLLAQIYEAKGDRASEAFYLREYVKSVATSDETVTMKLYLARLEQPDSGSDETKSQKPAATSNPLSAALVPENRKVEETSAPSASPANHIDPEVGDQSALSQDLLSACNLDEVLPEVERRVQEFVGNVQRFTATEHLVHESLNGSGQVSKSERWQYDYVVSIAESVPGLLEVSEYQNSHASADAVERNIVTKGLPALLLIFHPYYAGDFSIRCEGLTTWNGKPVWQFSFRQRTDKPSRIRSYSLGTDGRAYPVDLKGRAWFLAGNLQIVKLEADLVKAIPEIQLAVDHTSAEYGPVHFRSKGIDIWLPQAADLVSERKGKRFHERITFSDYMLFQIDNQQKISSPKPQELLAGPVSSPSRIPQDAKYPISVVAAGEQPTSVAPD